MIWSHPLVRLAAHMTEQEMTFHRSATSSRELNVTEGSNCDAIVTENLVRRFGDVEAVPGVNITIPKGEIYGFLGPNGAGKSTMGHMLCTLLAPTGGRATGAGFDVESDPGKVRLRI